MKEHMLMFFVHKIVSEAGEKKHKEVICLDGIPEVLKW